MRGWGARPAHGVTIVSSDKDLMQLVVDGKVELLDTMKNKRPARAEVIERFGVRPAKVVQVQALAGDFTEMCPACAGIGVKTAAELINTYGDVETLWRVRARSSSTRTRDAARECRQRPCFAEARDPGHKGADQGTALKEFATHEPAPNELIAFLKAMEFGTIIKRFCRSKIESLIFANTRLSYL